jgi:predicted MPP superfamily phosphohydrolase
MHFFHPTATATLTQYWNAAMEDRRLKRKLIEQRQLKAWSRRGSSPQAENFTLIKLVLDMGLWATGLRKRGERNALTPVLKHLRLTFHTLPDAFHGFKILHLSDLHIDGLTGLAERVADSLQALEVDLCVLTGDYRFLTRGSCREVYPRMACLLAQVNARDGVVGILGNHDVAEMVPEFEGMGVKMLLNTAVEIRRDLQSLWIVGVDDPHYYGCDDLPGALRGVPADAFKILLVHTPELLAEAQQHGIHLYLCGHTHGGQICLPFIGPVLTHANCPRKYVRGAWQYGTVKGYTSPGVGCSGVPARFLCPPELVLIELCQAQRLYDESEVNQDLTARPTLSGIEAPGV